MFYILNNQNTYSKTPETSYGGGTSMSFKKGFFIFDTETTDQRHYERQGRLEVEGDSYKVYTKMEHPIKVQAIFLRMKIEEMKENSFSFFMPDTFGRYVDEYKKIEKEHPEYLI